MKPSAPGPRPNILLITSDQQHWNTIGLHNPDISTPNLDRLASEGCLFRRAYCPNPTCTPSRSSIITGLYPSQHGAYSLGTKLDESVPTLGGRLSDRGYTSALMGKAHFQQLVSHPNHVSLESYPLLRDLNYWRDFHGPFYGFDHVELARNHADETHVGQHYAIWMEENGLPDWRCHFQNRWEFGNAKFEDPRVATEPQQHRWTLPEAYHYNNWIAERSGALIEAYTQAEKPFFLWSSFFDPHPPYLVPEPWDSMYDPMKITVPRMVPGEHQKNPEHFRQTQEANPDFSSWQEPTGNAMHGCESHLHTEEEMARDIAVYYGMVSCLDKYIGRILDRLEQAGARENTIVVFTSDHGHLFGQHGLKAKGPFHYEDLIRVPMIARWPGHIEPGSTSDHLQSLVDLAPTFLACSGEQTPAGMAGIDQSGSWRGRDTPARKHVLVENRHQPTTLHLKTYVDKRYKITVYRDRGYGELFDLQADPAEINNLWNQPEALELKTELLHRMVHAGLAAEPLTMPRVAPA